MSVKIRKVGKYFKKALLGVKKSVLPRVLKKIYNSTKTGTFPAPLLISLIPKKKVPIFKTHDVELRIKLTLIILILIFNPYFFLRCTNGKSHFNLTTNCYKIPLKKCVSTWSFQF